MQLSGSVRSAASSWSVGSIWGKSGPPSFARPPGELRMASHRSEFHDSAKDGVLRSAKREGGPHRVAHHTPLPLHPQVGGARQNAFCERQDAFHVEFSLYAAPEATDTLQSWRERPRRSRAVGKRRRPHGRGEKSAFAQPRAVAGRFARTPVASNPISGVLSPRRGTPRVGPCSPPCSPWTDSQSRLLFRGGLRRLKRTSGAGMAVVEVHPEPIDVPWTAGSSWTDSPATPVPP